MFEAAQHTAFWRDEYLQNHLWVSVCGLFAAGLALRSEAPIDAWLALAKAKFQRTEDSLGTDGASQEGVPYWTYGVEFLLKYWHLAGENPTSHWWKHTVQYREYLALPRNQWTAKSTLVDLADGPRTDYYGPDYILFRLAALNRDPIAQGLARDLNQANFTAPSARWLNLLWYDPTVHELPPSTLSTFHHFEDMGIVSARSSWDGNESLLVFKCGDPMGANASHLDFDAGGGHVHPDASHFVLAGSGDWLIRDDGYAWKQTAHHNTLLIDGKGQLGEGAQWFRTKDVIHAHGTAKITQAKSTPALDELAGDATLLYPKALGLKRFHRRLFFLKPNVLIIVDDIETDRERNLELRLHPEYPAESSNGIWLSKGPKTKLHIELLTPSGVETASGPIEGKSRDGGPMPMQTVQFTKTAAKWRNAIALSWSTASNSPIKVTLEQNPGAWTFEAAGSTARATW